MVPAEVNCTTRLRQLRWCKMLAKGFRLVQDGVLLPLVAVHRGWEVSPLSSSLARYKARFKVVCEAKSSMTENSTSSKRSLRLHVDP